jgi:hypothetical protein
MTKMNAHQALALDTDFYAEEDEEYGWGVFGDNSGFCYLLSDESACENEAERLRSFYCKGE